MRPSETRDVGRELWEHIEQHEAGRHHGVANLTMLSNRQASGRTFDTQTCLVSISRSFSKFETIVASTSCNRHAWSIDIIVIIVEQCNSD